MYVTKIKEKKRKEKAKFKVTNLNQNIALAFIVQLKCWKAYILMFQQWKTNRKRSWCILPSPRKF